MKIPRGAIQTLIGQFSGVQTVWVTRNMPQLGMGDGPRAWIKLSLGAYSAKGQDEYRQTANAENPNVLDTEIVGYRKIVVSLSARSLEDDVQAADLLEKVRGKLRTVTAAAAYAQAKIALVSISNVMPHTGEANSHATLDATLDITFGMLGGGKVDDDEGQTIGQVNGGTGIPFTPG